MKSELLSVAIESAPWDETTARDFARAAGTMDAAPDQVANAADVARGQRVAALCLGSERVGTMVYEVEDGELFVTSLTASVTRAGFDLLGTFQPQIEALGRRFGCVSVRFGTSRPGLVKKTQSLGYRVACVVMRKIL